MVGAVRLPALLLLLIASLGVSACGSNPVVMPPIEDSTFTAAAATACAAALPPLRPDLEDKEHRPPSEVAPTVLDRAERMAKLVDSLDEIPVRAGEARARKTRWIADWRAYVEGGMRYAAALRTEDPDRFSKVAVDADLIQQRISAVARASAMPDCALDGVPLPPRRGL